MITINFPESRYKHCYGVGKRMYTYAKDKLHKDENFCIEMFTLGNIHDIGYELDGDAFKHDEILANALQNSYTYWREIKYHSKLQLDYDSLAMRLLYFGDCTVDGNGNWCTFEQRLEDISNRHGKTSEVYLETEEIIKYLIKLGFDDSI